MPTQKKYSGFGGGRYGGGGGFGGGGMTLSFPPFTRAVKWLIIANTAIFLLMVLLQATAPVAYEFLYLGGALTPVAVVEHGWIWQIVTYSFLHSGLGHIFFNMLTLWFVGALLEQDWGARRFLELYFFSVLGAALTSVGLSYGHLLSLTPGTSTVGASGGIFGVLIAFAVLFGEMEFWMFPLPFRIKAKYLAAIWILVALVGSLMGGGNTAYVAHLGGIFFGFAYVKMFPGRGMGFSFSERYYGVRNTYYRWKRRRAAKKFEVYMRKVDRSQFFDEYGNYRGPGTGDKDKGDGKSNWIN